MEESTPLPLTPLEEAEPASRRRRARSSSIPLVLIPLAFVLGLFAGYLVWGRSAMKASQTAAAQGAAQGAAAQEGEQQFTRYDVPVDDDPVLGPQDAAITIIEFSDYECPFCTKWHAEVLPRIFETYPDQVRLVYRDFPLTSIHSSAFAAAEAANCAGEQDAYWAYHDKLFVSEFGLGKEAFEQYAGQLGLDMKAFNACVGDRRYQEEVSADINYAMDLGIRSTPTFFINGIALVGAQPFEVFKDVIDKELAGEFPK